MKCERCDGTGETTGMVLSDIPGYPQTEDITCPDCDGTGHVERCYD